MTPDEKAGKALPDIQESKDHRNIPIDRVGVRHVKFPIEVLDRADERQHTIGDFTLTVDLPSEFKGTHMSRFLEVLSKHEGEVTSRTLPNILHDLKQQLHAEEAHIEVAFTYFVTKKAPVSGAAAKVGCDCVFMGTSNGSHDDLVLRVTVPVTTLCPCSKEISDYGAHNQRGWVTVRVRTSDHVWLEEVIEMIEGAASCGLYPVLKRPDEKWVTEHAYDNPRFVEDMVREVALAFDKDGRFVSYEIEVENEESIHAHNAYASLKRP